MQRALLFTTLVILCTHGRDLSGAPPLRPTSQFVGGNNLVSAAAGRSAPLSKASGSLPPGQAALERRDQAPTIQKRRDDELLALLSEPAWVRSPVGEESPLEVVSPWHHVAVTELVGRSRANRQAAQSIKSELNQIARRPHDAQAAFAAAVALAYLGDPSAASLLDAVLLDDSGSPAARQARLPQRAVAAFALAQLPEALDRASLRRVLQQWTDSPRSGRTTDDGRSSTSLRLRTENAAPERFSEDETLIVGVYWAMTCAAGASTDFDPALDSDIAWGAQSGSIGIRRAAAISFAGRRYESLPDSLHALLQDEEPGVRLAALAAAGANPGPDVMPFILAASTDIDRQARMFAIELLGRFGDAETARRLDQVFANGSELEREAAVNAARRRRLGGLVLRASEDVSARVREVAAAAIGDIAGPDGVKQLRKLLDDRSSRVQVAAVRSIAALPTRQSVPMLLEALDSAAQATRAAAAAALARHFPPAVKFPVQRSAADRSASLAQLRELWEREKINYPDAGNGSLDPVQSGGVHAADVERLLLDWHRGGALERGEAVRALTALGAVAMPDIERFYAARNSYPDPNLVRDLLGNFDRVYQLLGELWHATRHDESTHVTALAEAVKRQSLTRMQGVFLAEYLSRTTSTAAWLQLAPLLEQEFPAEAAALDVFALRHADPMVRKTGCERIARRPNGTMLPQSAALLAKLFDDGNSMVRLAALESAGAAGNPIMTNGLQKALKSNLAWERLAAAGSLSQLGDVAGNDEIRRLLVDQDPAVRRAAIRTLSLHPGSDRSHALRLLSQSLDDGKLEVVREGLGGIETLTGTTYARNADGTPRALRDQVRQWKTILESDHTSALLGN